MRFITAPKIFGEPVRSRAAVFDAILNAFVRLINGATLPNRASNPKTYFVVATVSRVPISGGRAQRNRTVPP